MNKKCILSFLLVLIPLITIHSAEIDQFTDREKYQETAADFTGTLNDYTNSLIRIAVGNYNNKYSRKEIAPTEVHRLIAFEIYKVTAGEQHEKFSSDIPKTVNLIYALGKSGHGPIQKWVQSDSNKEWWVLLSEDNIYSDIYPEPFNKNYIVKVGGEFIGPDKIDHFFDQGYSYWVKSNFGEDDKEALEFGVESEFGWYGLKAGGVFSFADLRANWGGYQFYKNLFKGEDPHLRLDPSGEISIGKLFDWNEYMDWQYDELKNPSVLNKNNMRRILRHIETNIERYRETYQYLEDLDFFESIRERDDYYLTGDLDYDPSGYLDLKWIMTERIEPDHS